MKRMALTIISCAIAAVAISSIVACSGSKTSCRKKIVPPALDNNPQMDMILTNRRPILSVGNPAGMEGEYTLTMEISADPGFPRDQTISYDGIKPQSEHISEKQIEADDELADGTYHWRVRTVAADGRESEWAKTRFHVDVKNSRTFSGFLRAPVKSVSVSGGEDPKNIIDWNDEGQATYWCSEPRAAGEEFSWVVLDMGRPMPVARFWMLSTRKTSLAPGWLTDFVWQASDDLTTWKDIPGTEVKGNDTYVNIIDFEPVGARYYRLAIRSQNSLQAQINAIIPYVKGDPAVPAVPDEDYVLIVGNQMNGFTYTQLAKFVEARGLKSVTIPHYEMSLKVLKSLSRRPTAIIFSGNNADWQYLPLFEYYGEWQIYREVNDIPMMGICAGNEFFAMAYGVSFSQWMGWFADTMFRISEDDTPQKVKILPEFEKDPIFEGVPNPFQAVEIHSWAISPLFLKDDRYEEFKKTAESSYIQAIKSVQRPIYSEQFHGAVVNDYNQSGTYLANFLKIARNRAKAE